MPFNVEFGDVTKYDADIIVSSLGYYSPFIYGDITLSLIESFGEPFMEELEDNISNSIKERNEIFIMEKSINNPKRILFCYPPYKKHDRDYKNYHLKELFRKILNTVYVNGYKSVAIPFIGTGANGYKPENIYNAALDVLNEDEKYNEELDIRFVLFREGDIPTSGATLMSATCNDIEIETDILPSIDSPVSKFSKRDLEYQNSINRIDKFLNDDDVPFKEEFYFSSPLEYILDYIDFKGLKKTDIFRDYGTLYNSKNIYKLKKPGAFKKDDLFRMSIIVHMNKGSIKKALKLGGWNLSPIDDMDLEYLSLIEREIIPGDINDDALLYNIAMNKYTSNEFRSLIFPPKAFESYEKEN